MRYKSSRTIMGERPQRVSHYERCQPIDWTDDGIKQDNGFITNGTNGLLDTRQTMW
jgi:hypothetical protein